jgi:hypothetical protein
MEPKELVLLYGLSASEPEGDLVQAILREAEIPFKEIQTQEVGMPVGALAGLDAAETCPPMVESFPQSTMVLCGFSEQRLREVLSLCRDAKAGSSVMKAVLTPKNRDWRFCDLLSELNKEREAFLRMIRARKESPVKNPST